MYLVVENLRNVDGVVSGLGRLKLGESEAGALSLVDGDASAI